MFRRPPEVFNWVNDNALISGFGKAPITTSTGQNVRTLIHSSEILIKHPPTKVVCKELRWQRNVHWKQTSWSTMVLTQFRSSGSKTTYMVVHTVKPCHICVPQCSILGPLLFLLYVNDLPQYVQNQNCNIFADDTIIYSFGSNVEELSCKMQGALDSIMPWYKTNRLSINANKSAVMLIGRPSQVLDDIDIKINDVGIEQVQSMKYLGIYINSKLSWDVQCDKLCSNVAGKISVLRRIRQCCQPSTLKLIYERTVQSSFDYACSVWCHKRQHLKITMGSKLRC